MYISLQCLKNYFETVWEQHVLDDQNDSTEEYWYTTITQCCTTIGK